MNGVEFLSEIFAFAVSMMVTPGPNNIMLMAAGGNYGSQHSIPQFLGVCVGLPLMVLAVGLGLGTLFEDYPQLHHLIRAVGVAYLLYLSWSIANTEYSSLERKKTRPLSFVQSVLFQWVNPKAWVIATEAIAVYTSCAINVYYQILLTSSIFFLVSFPCAGVWLFFGVRLKNILKNRTHQRMFNICMVLLLVTSLIPVVKVYIV